jgi:uncharacterized protein YfaS (alpha-2-macroglobulin family)
MRKPSDLDRFMARARGPGILAMAMVLAAGGCAAGGSSGQETAPGTSGVLAGDPDDLPPLPIPHLRLPGAPVPEDPTADPAEVEPFLRLILSDGPGQPAPGLAREPAPRSLPRSRVEEILRRLPPPPDDGGAGMSGVELGTLAAGAGTSTRAGGASGKGPDVRTPDPGTTHEPTPLRVHGVVPMGTTDLAPHVTVIFSEPMVPLGPDGEPLTGEPPARLEPEPPGRWRWLDVRTLRFEPDAGRLPGATRYTLRVPAGARSAGGTRLLSGVEASFATRGAVATGARPNMEIVDQEPLIFMVFDQRVRATDVLAAARLRVDGVLHPVRLAAAEEVDREPRLRAAAEEAGEGRWTALRPERPLPRGADVLLTLSPELASAEGPRSLGRAQELRFFTRRDMALDRARCDRPDRPCPPQGSWSVLFTNPLDPESVTEERVRFEPAVDRLRVHASGRMLWVRGDFLPNGTYRVVLDGRIRDRFGEELGHDEELELHFGAPPPLVRIPGGAIQTLDPGPPPRIEIDVRGVKELQVEVFRVEPEDWTAFFTLLRPGPRERPPEALPGTRVSTSTVTVPDDGRGFSRVPVELGAALREGRGHVIVWARGKDAGGSWIGSPIAGWIQATQLGLEAVWDGRRIVTRLFSLLDGTPLAGGRIELPASGAVARTDATGGASLSLAGEADSLVVARLGPESAILPRSPASVPWGPAAWVLDPSRPAAAWSAFTDRGLYRPGEAGRIHGWIRERAIEEGTGPHLPVRVDSVRYRIRFPNPEGSGPEGRAGPGHDLEGAVALSPTGAFHIPFQVPSEARAGGARVMLEAVGPDVRPEWWSHELRLQVEEFRRPEYEVRVEAEPRVRFVDEPVDVRLDARYFDGPPLRSAPVRWRVHPARAFFTPPGWGGWWFSPDWRSAPPALARVAAATVTREAETDREGVHVLRIRRAEASDPLPVTLDVRAEVQDLNRQAGSAGTRVLLHPASAYAGIRTPTGFVLEGEPLEFQVVAVDPEGRPVRNVRLRVRVERVEHEGSTGRGPLQALETLPSRCEEGGVEGPDGEEVPGLHCRVTAAEEGLLRVAAEVEDDLGRRALAERVVTVRPILRGGEFRWPVGRPFRGDGLEVALDRDVYEPGDTVRMAVSSPESPVRGLATMFHNGIRTVVPLDLAGPEGRVEIPVGEGQLGESWVLISLWGPGAGRERLRASARFTVSMDHRRLEVAAEPAAPEAAPGDEVRVEVTVRDAAGAPVPDGEVTLWLVDEAVLSLARYGSPNPLQALNAPDRMPTGELHGTDLVRWSRRALGPGWLTGRLTHGSTGRHLAGYTVRLPDLALEATSDRSGEFALEEVPAGSHRIEILVRDEVVEERRVIIASEGTDLGELLVADPPPRVPRGPEEASHPSLDALGAVARLRGTLTLDGLTVSPFSPGEPAEIEMPPPPASADLPPPPGPDPVAVREVFSPLAAFEAALETDAEGRAVAVIRLPDTVTRYRIFAVAVRGAGEAGTGESTLIVRRDLLVRSSFPRFLHPGDRTELSVLVQNLTGEDREVEVAARAVGLELEGSGGARLRIPAGDRREVRLPARAGAPGSARIEAVAVSGEAVDAVAEIVPIRPALSPRAVALYAELGDAGPFRLPIQVPRGSLPGFGGLELALSTSLLQSLADELLLLFREPELDVEATIARVLAVASLGDGIEPVAAEGLPSPRELRGQLQEDIEFLGRVYLEGWSRSGFRRTDHSMPLTYVPSLVSLDGALALHRAREAGYELPDGLREALAAATERHLSGLVRVHGEAGSARGGYLAYGMAYAAYVHQELGGGSGAGVASWAAGLVPDDLPSEALAWLYAVLSRDEGSTHLADEFRTALLNRLLEEAGTATFRTGPSLTVAGSAPHEERLLLDSRRRTDAIVLSALLRTEPHHPALPRLVRGLIGHRAGEALEVQWGSIYEAGWLLMAVGDYVRIREEEVPDLTVRARLDGRLLTEEVFRGRSLRVARAGVGLDVLGGPTPEDPEGGSLLAVERSGTGTLYLRAGLRYSPSDPFQPPEERGFLVTRRYEAVDDPDDVKRDAEGIWRIRAGARVRVRLTLATTARRYQVRLRDALPGGFEAVNPGLEGALLPDPADDGPQASPAGIPPCFVHMVSQAHPMSYWANWTECRMNARLRMGLPWHTYRELRSDRVEAHTALLPAGTYETTYLVRATMPGTYVAAPPRAWEARHPETRGRGEADRVVVEGGR